MHRFVQKFLRAEDGATAIEYALIAGLIALVIVGTVETIGQTMADVFYAKIIAAF